MKRWQLIGAPLLAVLMVAALAVVLIRSRGQPPEPSTPPKPLSDIKMSEVMRLTVRKTDGRECRLELNDQGVWFAVAPVVARANQNYVVWYLEDLLSSESSNPQPLSKVDLAKAGLVTPTLTIMVGTRDGGERTLEVGAFASQYLSYYVRIGQQVWLLPFHLVDRAARMLEAPPLEPQPTPTTRAVLATRRPL